MKPTKNPFKTFAKQLIITTSIVFGIHLLLLNVFKQPLFANKIVLAYVLNTLLALIIYGVIYKLRHKYKNGLGFLFMIGSFLKFVLFFLVFYNFYMQDGDISGIEYAAFFVPYFVCLIIETSSLAKWLNNREKTNS